MPVALPPDGAYLARVTVVEAGTTDDGSGATQEVGVEGGTVVIGRGWAGKRVRAAFLAAT